MLDHSMLKPVNYRPPAPGRVGEGRRLTFGSRESDGKVVGPCCPPFPFDRKVAGPCCPPFSVKKLGWNLVPSPASSSHFAQKGSWLQEGWPALLPTFSP